MCRDLNIPAFCIFLNFFKYGRVLNMCEEAIMEEFLIFQDSEYSRFLHMQELRKVLNVPEYGWIMSCGRVLNISGQIFTGFQPSFQF